MAQASLVHEYYDALDDGDYEALRDVLDQDFRQERGDRTFESREAFVSFMRDGRPRHDTRHEIERIYRGPDGDFAVTGRLMATDAAGAADAGEVLFDFLDIFEMEAGTIGGLRTFVDGV